MRPVLGLALHSISDGRRGSSGHLRQLGEVHNREVSLVLGQPEGSRAALRLVGEIAERLAGRVADYQRLRVLLDRLGRREAAGGGHR